MVQHWPSTTRIPMELIAIVILQIYYNMSTLVIFKIAIEYS